MNQFRSPTTLTAVGAKRLAALAFGAFCVALPLSPFAASFPCEKAATDVERTICKDKQLSELDVYLGRYYFSARYVLRHAEECLASDQRTWLRDVRDACKDKACLKMAYLLRLSELDGLQPGVTALKNLELPSTPVLVEVVPPAQDQVAAPRHLDLKPFSVQGKLRNEVSSGDGYVILSKDGSKHVVIATMFLDDPTGVLDLDSLSKASATYLVRGHAEPGARGNEAFAQGKCRFIYRMPR